MNSKVVAQHGARTLHRLTWKTGAARLSTAPTLASIARIMPTAVAPQTPRCALRCTLSVVGGQLAVPRCQGWSA